MSVVRTDGAEWTLDPSEVLAEDYRHTMIPACRPLMAADGAVVGVVLTTRVMGRDVLVEALPEPQTGCWRVQGWSVACTEDEQLRELGWAAARAGGVTRSFVLSSGSVPVLHAENRAHPAAYAVLSGLSDVARRAARRDALTSARDV